MTPFYKAIHLTQKNYLIMTHNTGIQKTDIK